MKPLLYLYLCLTLLLFIHHTITTSSNAFPTAILQQTCTTPTSVEDTCKKVTNERPAIGYDFCVKSLKAATTSLSSAQSIELHDLAVIATKLAIAHAVSSESKVEELMDLESKPTIKAVYDTCLDVYTDAADYMRNALDNISNRLYQKATALLGTAVDATEKCEVAFNDAKVLFPLVAMDKDYGKLASIAHGIIVSLE